MGNKSGLMMLSAALVGIALASAAQAADFGIDNTQLMIQPGHPSAVVTLHNNLIDPVRCQVTVVAWEQDNQGQIKLLPTQDLVFFPELFTLKGNGDQPVRVAFEGKFEAREKTYRILIEELPPFEKGVQQTAMSTRLRLSLPIFVQPNAAMAKLHLNHLVQNSNQLSFDLQNDGTAHAKITAIKAEALDAQGKVLFEHALQGWYLLAGGVREYSLELEQSKASQVRSIRVEGEAEAGAFQATLDLSSAPRP